MIITFSRKIYLKIVIIVLWIGNRNNLRNGVKNCPKIVLR